MKIQAYDEIPSTAAIAGHPIHPVLITFPVASISGALVSDLLYTANRDRFWARAAFLLTGAGLVTGAFAAVFGLIDFLTLRRVRELRGAWLHLIGNIVVMLLALTSVLLRRDDHEAGARNGGLTLSMIMGGLLLGTGWLGGELSYRHKVGVNSQR